MLRVRVRYGRAEDFLKDDREQLAHRGLFVRVVPPPGLEQFSVARLIVMVGDQRAVIDGQVVQVAPGIGVAISFTDAGDDALAALRAYAHGGGAQEDADPVFEIVTDDAGAGLSKTPDATPDSLGSATSGDATPDSFGSATSGDATPDSLGTVTSGDATADSLGSARSEVAASTAGHAPAGPMTKKDKIQLALRGTKDQRLKIIRDTDRTLHIYLLKNPRLGLDEVTTLAKTPTISVEVLKAVAERREWYQRSEVATALVRNPKTPVPIAIRMLDHISQQELRRLAKSDGARMPILQAARRKVVGGG